MAGCLIPGSETDHFRHYGGSWWQSRAAGTRETHSFAGEWRFRAIPCRQSGKILLCRVVGSSFVLVEIPALECASFRAIRPFLSRASTREGSVGPVMADRK